MQINYTLDAFASLTSLINFIESKNTQGAGLRWLERYEEFLIKELLLPVGPLVFWRPYRLTQRPIGQAGGRNRPVRIDQPVSPVGLLAFAA